MFARIQLRGAYGYDTDEASAESAFYDDTPSMTDQSFAEECDINTIVRRFGLTGEMPAAPLMPSFADFEETYDFHTSMLRIKQAETEFLRLPAELRYRFGNDPGALIAFLEDDRNREEAVKLGLVRAPEVPAPVVLPGDAGGANVPPAS